MKILIIYNPKSGNNTFSKKIPYVKKKLIKNNLTDFTFYASTGPNDITNYIKENLEREKYDVLVISGGDGTLNEAINGVMKLEVKPKIAYIPSGTANDVGYMLGMRKSIKQSFKEIIKHNVVKMDVCKMNDRHFMYTSGCGKFTNVSYSTTSLPLKKALGKMYYFFEAAKQIPTTTEMNMTIKYDGKEIKGKYFLMLALTGNRVAGFTIKKNKQVKLNNGKIELVLFNQKNFSSIFNMTNYFILGENYRNGIESITASEFEIISEENLDYNVDGENWGSCNKATLTIQKEALEIFVSSKSKKKFF